MNLPPPLILDTDWLVYPPADTDAAYGVSVLDDSTWDSVATLAEWPVDRLAYGKGVQLKRHFDLEPIGEVCLRFVLQLDQAPAGTRVYVNGWHVGTTQTGQALTADVTDAVTLEGNLLHLKLSRRGALGGLRVVAMLCPA
jgi:hypothetical protein